MKDHFKNPDEKEFQRFSIELKKMKIAAEYGGTFGESDPSLPPEIENRWLDQILRFEEAYTRRELMTVYEKAGMPIYRMHEEINDEDIHAELLRLIHILWKNQIVIDSSDEIDEREMYRFITEILFDEIIEDIPVPGFIHHFIYEEFMD